MSEGHLNPARGWKLIRDGGGFTKAEAEHLTNCSQCSDWLYLFADLARSVGFKPEINSAFVFVAEDRHLTAGRAWTLIRDGGQLTLPETGHLYYCLVCNEWLSKFVVTARNAGFSPVLVIPPCDSQRKAG